MARPNGGWISGYVAPTRQTARGVWSLRDQFQTLRSNTWPGWSPIGLANVVGWWDAGDRDTVTLTSSNTVSQINDKSGNARHASQATASAQPSYVAISGGMLALSLDGVNDVLTFSGITLNDNNTFVFSVFARAASGIASIDLGATTASGYATWWFSDNVVYSVLRGTSFGTHGSASTSTGMFVNGMVRTSGGTQAYRNGSTLGTAQASGNTGNVTLDAIGRAQGAGGAVHQGLLCEVIVGRGTISADDIDRVTGYLAWRWGAQTRLPAGHPYLNRAP